MSKRKVRILVTILYVASILVCFKPSYAYAEAERVSVDVSDIENGMDNLVNQLNEIVEGVASYSGNYLYLYPESLKGYNSAKEQKNVINELIITVANVNMTSKKYSSSYTKNKISTAISELGDSVDILNTYLAKSSNKEVSNAVSLFSKYLAPHLSKIVGFGLFAVIVLAFLGFLSDISFVELEWYALLLSGGDYSKKPRFVSRAAYLTHKEVNTDECSSKMAILVYLKKQAIPLAIVSIIVVYLLRNRLATFVIEIINFFRGF